MEVTKIKSLKRKLSLFYIFICIIIFMTPLLVLGFLKGLGYLVVLSLTLFFVNVNVKNTKKWYFKPLVMKGEIIIDNPYETHFYVRGKQERIETREKFLSHKDAIDEKLKDIFYIEE